MVLTLLEISELNLDYCLQLNKGKSSMLCKFRMNNTKLTIVLHKFAMQKENM